ncbi:VOC family protein [Novosphingobium sp.]|uniref:VOC family protein n=1 Tax=Novosphingobium sp. TaxID=1874826 RepID=UPI0038B814D0
MTNHVANIVRGSIVWYELMTTDADGAGAFYNAVVGWTLSGHDPHSPIDYRHFLRSNGSNAGGVLQLTADMQAEGAHSAWVPYFAVEDVDAATAAILADGGRALGPRMDIAEGSFAMVTDPSGTPFYLMRPIPPQDAPDAVSDAFSRDKVQHVRWNDLLTPDLPGALAFYARHFGFDLAQVMPMGPAGNYHFINHHGLMLGGIMERQNEADLPLWRAYFGVPSALAARAAIEAHGGTVLAEPHEVPGGDWVVVARDPQGALFGVVGPRGE